MGTIVIKPERDVDFYIGWSTITENPHWWGSRAEATEYLAEDRSRRGNIDHPPEERLARADQHGTSDMSVRDGEWGDDEFIYEQRGILHRKHLIEACRTSPWTARRAGPCGTGTATARGGSWRSRRKRSQHGGRRESGQRCGDGRPGPRAEHASHGQSAVPGRSPAARPIPGHDRVRAVTRLDGRGAQGQRGPGTTPLVRARGRPLGGHAPIPAGAGETALSRWGPLSRKSERAPCLPVPGEANAV